jgi:hypothetical protein
VELSVKYIVKSFAMLWQHVFQAAVCVSSAMQCDSARHSIHTTACIGSLRMVRMDRNM